MPQDDTSSRVKIGDVRGGIHGSMIAGGDIKDATITLGGQQVQADKDPSIGELKELLNDIQQDLIVITAQQETLTAISPSAPFAAQGAEASVETAVDSIPEEPEPNVLLSIQQRLKEALSFVSSIFDSSTALATEAGDAVEAVDALVEKLQPLIVKLGVASFWVMKLIESYQN